MLGKVYQKNVCAVVVDEAHCILEWYVNFFYLIKRDRLLSGEAVKGHKNDD